MQEIKSFNLRMNREIWEFLKIQSVVENSSMTQIIVELINKYKKTYEKKLTCKDALV